MSPSTSAPEFTDLLDAADPARLFAIGGMFLVIAGMIFGDLYAIFILHPNVADIGREMGAAVNAAASVLLGIGAALHPARGARAFLVVSALEVGSFAVAQVISLLRRPR